MNAHRVSSYSETYVFWVRLKSLVKLLRSYFVKVDIQLLFQVI